MCGFIGGTEPAWDYSRALDAIAHRGPDDSRLVSNENVSLGFCRLAIIDLDATANQPMSSASEDVSLVFNGEIYGFRRLRDQLEKLGAEFRTQSDTEVVLQAYLIWGEEFIDYVDGMFAIAIWDKRSNKVILFRDRAGIKPLFYFYNGNDFAFASELKAIESALPSSQLDVDSTALYDFLGYRYVPAPKTLYRNVYKLHPGHKLEFDLSSRKLADPRRFWQLEPTNDRDISLAEACEELRSLIDASVSDQLIAGRTSWLFSFRWSRLQRRRCVCCHASC